MTRSGWAGVLVAAVALSGCGQQVIARPRTPAGSAAPSPCPTGSPLTGHGAQMVDYVDFVVLGHQMYLNAAMYSPRPTARQPGPVVATVRCTLQSAPTDHGPPPFVDGTASFLKVGAPLYQAAGLPSSCEVLARTGDGVVTYVLEVDQNGHAGLSDCWRHPA